MCSNSRNGPPPTSGGCSPLRALVAWGVSARAGCLHLVSPLGSSVSSVPGHCVRPPPHELVLHMTAQALLPGEGTLTSAEPRVRTRCPATGGRGLWGKERWGGRIRKSASVRSELRRKVGAGENSPHHSPHPKTASPMEAAGSVPIFGERRVQASGGVSQ